MESPIQRAIDIAGSEAKLGALIGCSQVAINKAKHRGSVSAEMAVAIDRATEGKVSKSDLRPDLFSAQPERAAS
jgi:DNA-binding transcriptional regulator YdaS (Cro superfamily)